MGTGFLRLGRLRNYRTCARRVQNHEPSNRYAFIAPIAAPRSPRDPLGLGAEMPRGKKLCVANNPYRLEALVSAAFEPRQEAVHHSCASHSCSAGLLSSIGASRAGKKRVVLQMLAVGLTANPSQPVPLLRADFENVRTGAASDARSRFASL